MPDIDAETSFINSMQAISEAAGQVEENSGRVGAIKVEPQSTEDHDHLQQARDISFASDTGDISGNVAEGALSPNSSSSSASRSRLAATSTDVGDPAHSNRSSDTLALPAALGTAQRPTPSPTNSVNNRSRTIGGFVIDDDDDEDNETLLHSTNSNGSLRAPFSSVGGGSSNVVFGRYNANPTRDVSLPNVAEEREDIQVSRDDGAASEFVSGPHNTVPSSEGRSPNSTKNFAPSQVNTVAHQSAASTALPKARLPHDTVGILEDRIKEDPRGDMDAWLALIAEHQKRNKLEDARKVYERFFKIFPTAAEQWVAYVNMELTSNNFWHVEQIFTASLLRVPNVQLWSVYMDYVRRRNNLTTDTTGDARKIIQQAYDFVLQNIGLDKDSGRIWHDYVAFVKSGPGVAGGTSWQDQQKMDNLRKLYQRALCIPIHGVDTLWGQYTQFEKSLNKMTGPKFIQERSPAYMSARSAFIELSNITQGLNRTTLPRLPPALGFEGDEEYLRQVELWKKWIQWEKNDPLDLKEENPTEYKSRILYVFKQAVMALRFWPEMWFEAAEFCFLEALEKDGNEFLQQGIAANPESCLLAFKQADRLEATLPVEESEEGLKRRGAAVREPYDKLLDASYELIAKIKAREAQAVARIEEYSGDDRHPSPSRNKNDDDDDDDDDVNDDANAKRAAREAQIQAIKDGNAVQTRLLSRTISFTWIALMRAMRRIQGKGKVNSDIGGSRQIFTDARKRGRLTSDVYVASALMEYHCYKDPAATKIFERGMKLFPNDEDFALEYLKHLIAINDVTNARAVFETTVSKLSQKSRDKAKPIYAFFHQYEAHYGELSQVIKLEKRMSDLYPEDPQLTRFSHRYSAPGFDPTAVRPIISPATQTRPKGGLTMIANTPEVDQSSPPTRFAPIVNSPKRPFAADESDNEAARPRKLIRGESPLKGAAGRRLDQQKRNQMGANMHSSGWSSQYPPPPPPTAIPRDVLFLLSIIPKAETYHATRFKAEEMVRLLRETSIPSGPGGVPVRASQMQMAPVSQAQQNGVYKQALTKNPSSSSSKKRTPSNPHLFHLQKVVDIDSNEPVGYSYSR